MAPRRLIYDVTTLARAGGQAVGIVRVCRELARYAHAHRRGTVFVINDTRINAFRQVSPQWLDAILDGAALVDMSVLPTSPEARSRERESVPAFVRNLLFWIQHPRRRAIVLLERLRLTAPRPVAWLAEALQERLLSPRYRSELTDAIGQRRSLVPYDLAAGDPVEFRAGDILVFAGSEWGSLNFDALRSAKEQHGVAVAQLIYDTIPLLFPQFYLERNAQAFRRFFDHVMPLADLVVFTAHQIAQDAADYCRSNGLHFGNTAVVPLGSNPIPQASSEPVSLPAGLEAGRYAIFVSTVEPRKNHALLLAVWKRLYDAGVPQAHGFKLVLVGRRGWLVDDVYAELQAYANEEKGLLLFANVNDADLGRLYRNAAFGLYPSLYEGYGLPLVEMFHLGKTVLSSSGGALKEVAGEFAPCLDPRNEDAWFAALKLWIEQPSARAPYEAAIRERFRHPTWGEASARFFAAIDETLG